MSQVVQVVLLFAGPPVLLGLLAIGGLFWAKRYDARHRPADSKEQGTAR
ncbi:hypothetical protein [Chitinimonas koreensis]|nr:hypothetical protein [Chitinimonas koreensis]QNM95506.1 hypothetical protein H9L41_16770 [Chitinimonas koreensis]